MDNGYSRSFKVIYLGVSETHDYILHRPVFVGVCGLTSPREEADPQLKSRLQPMGLDYAMYYD